MADQSTTYANGYSAGYAAAMLQAARIADSHRAMNLNSGMTEAGLACSSVSGFIVQAAREAGLWDESLPQPLIKSNAEREAGQ